MYGCVRMKQIEKDVGGIGQRASGGQRSVYSPAPQQVEASHSDNAMGSGAVRDKVGVVVQVGEKSRQSRDVGVFKRKGVKQGGGGDASQRVRDCVSHRSGHFFLRVSAIPIHQSADGIANSNQGGRQSRVVQLKAKQVQDCQQANDQQDGHIGCFRLWDG
jgi:hypothetical protein